MKLQIFRTLWGADDDYPAVATAARDAGFDGIEGGLPEPKARIDFKRAIDECGLRYIGEICTGAIPLHGGFRSVARALRITCKAWNWDYRLTRIVGSPWNLSIVSVDPMPGLSRPASDFMRGRWR
jgi:hypothetical protein